MLEFSLSSFLGNQWLPSLKITVRPWKSPSFPVNTIKMVDFPASYVSLQESNKPDVGVPYEPTSNQLQPSIIGFRWTWGPSWHHLTSALGTRRRRLRFPGDFCLFRVCRVWNTTQLYIWDEKRFPGDFCLGYVRYEILPKYIIWAFGIVIKHEI